MRHYQVNRTDEEITNSKQMRKVKQQNKLPAYAVAEQWTEK